jgi:hypothetical protein
MSFFKVNLESIDVLLSIEGGIYEREYREEKR